MTATETTRAELAVRDVVITGLRTALVDGEHGLKDVPSLTKHVLQDELWRERVVRATGEIVRFARFTDFVSASVPNGLGADLDMLKRICADDPEAIDLIDRATQSPVGTNQHGNNVPTQRPEGNTAEKAIRRLRKDRPDLHAEVMAKRMSPHAAAVQAGFRPKTCTVPANPLALGRWIASHYSADDISAIIAVLQVPA